MIRFQQRVHDWMLKCFGATIAVNRQERSHRFLEEALEVVQACGCTRHEAVQLVDYVYGRPVGDVHQEIGGALVTLAALSTAWSLDQEQCADLELDRCWKKIDLIRAKQASKPRFSPLPTPKDACGECGSNIGWGRKHYPSCSQAYPAKETQP